MRRHQADEHPTEHAARGHLEVEGAQVARGRTQAVQLAMAHHAAGQQRAPVREELEGQRPVGPLELGAQHAAHRDDEQGHPEGAPVERLALEGEDEGEEIDPQGQHPEEGPGRHVPRELVRRGQQQHRRAGAQPEPRQGVPRIRPLRLRGLRWSLLHGPLGGRRLGPLPHVPRARGTTGGEDQEAHTPGPALRRAGQGGLDEEGVAQQREQRAGVGQGVEPVGRDTWPRAAEPALHQGRGGGQHEEGEPERDGQHRQQPAGEQCFASRGAPLGPGRHRRAHQQRAHHEHRHREREQSQVEPHLAARGEARGARVCVGVARQERALEEEHARRPHRGRAAEPGQRVPAHQRLDTEEQEGAGEEGEGVAGHEGGGSQGRLRRPGRAGAARPSAAGSWAPG